MRCTTAGRADYPGAGARYIAVPCAPPSESRLPEGTARDPASPADRDEPALARGSRHASRQRFDVTVAADGEQGLDAVQRTADLILLDVMLPDQRL